MKSVIGERFVSIDLDAVIVDDITPLFFRHEDFVIWQELYRKTPYCGSLFMMTAGARQEVWKTFTPRRYRPNRRGKWPYGTDQDHICNCLYPYEAYWDSRDGVYNFNHSIKKWDRFSKEDAAIRSKYKQGRFLTRYNAVNGTKHQAWKIPKEFRWPASKANGELPPNARIVFFNGKHDPSEPGIQEEYSWVKEHWRK
jgi:hypothetical protein